MIEHRYDQDRKHRDTEDTEFGHMAPLCSLCLCVSIFVLVGAAFGTGDYQIKAHLPENLKSSLPTIEQIEAEFGDVDDE